METTWLDSIGVAAPCKAAWDDMAGTDRVRACGLCKLSVYDMSAMSRPEAEALVQAREGRLCVRFFRRADGKVLTDNCPIGLKRVRRRLMTMAAAIAAVLAVGGGGAVWAKTGRKLQIPEDSVLRRIYGIGTLVEWLDPAEPQIELMGDICIPTPPVPTPPSTASGR